MSEKIFYGITAKTVADACLSCEKTTLGSVSLYAFTAEFSGEGSAMELRWSRPMTDISYSWHSAGGFGRSLKPDWGGKVESCLSSGCPLTCFFTDNDLNVYTIALDECLQSVERAFGVREEGGLLSCYVRVPLPTGAKRIQVTLRIDETPCRYEDAIRGVVAWWEEKFAPMPVPAAARQPLYSCWYSLHQAVFAEDVEKQARLAADLGMKVIIVDDGWQTDDGNRGYAYCGDWEPALSKIPDMAAHVARVQAMGLKYMLWYSVPFVGIHSKAAQRFAGKFLYTNERLNTYVLDPRYPDVRAYLVGIYEKALREWNLDGFKLDFIDSFKNTQNKPFAEGMDIEVLEDAVLRLMTDVMRTLTAIKPDILIEFRQSYIGPAIRAFGNMLRVGDCPNMPLSNHVGTVDLRLTSGGTAVHSDMLLWNKEEKVENVAGQIEASMFGAVQFSPRLDEIPHTHLCAVRFWTDFLKKEEKLLLESELRAECPQLLYPLVRTEDGARSLIAVYAPNYVCTVPASRLNEVIWVNACAGTRVVGAFDTPCVWTVEIRDCMGEIVSHEEKELCGLVSLDVPANGLIYLQK